VEGYEQTVGRSQFPNHLKQLVAWLRFFEPRQECTDVLSVAEHRFCLIIVEAYVTPASGAAWCHSLSVSQYADDKREGVLSRMIGTKKWRTPRSFRSLHAWLPAMHCWRHVQDMTSAPASATSSSTAGNQPPSRDPSGLQTCLSLLSTRSSRNRNIQRLTRNRGRRIRLCWKTKTRSSWNKTTISSCDD